MGDLEYYAAGCRRTLDDSSKARFHDKEQGLLDAIEAEIARQNGSAGKLPEPASADGEYDGADIPF